MKKLKLYLDTSAIGYLDEPTSPKEMDEMYRLWELLRLDAYDIAISQITLDEITDNKNSEKVDTLLNFINEINYQKIELTEPAMRIANLVAKTGVLDEKHRNDRLHIGCAIESSCDVLVSLNFKHLVNVRTIRGIRGIALMEGYGNIDIVTPSALLQGGDE